MLTALAWSCQPGQSTHTIAWLLPSSSSFSSLAWGSERISSACHNAINAPMFPISVCMLPVCCPLIGCRQCNCHGDVSVHGCCGAFFCNFVFLWDSLLRVHLICTVQHQCCAGASCCQCCRFQNKGKCLFTHWLKDRISKRSRNSFLKFYFVQEISAVLMSWKVKS